jgi:hypothetical protein
MAICALQAILERPHDRRPVTLVGYSMGCRVIFACLKELARHLEIPEQSEAEAEAEEAAAVAAAAALLGKDAVSGGDWGGGDPGAEFSDQDTVHVHDYGDLDAELHALDTEKEAEAEAVHSSTYTGAITSSVSSAASMVSSSAGVLGRGMYSVGSMFIPGGSTSSSSSATSATSAPASTPVGGAGSQHAHANLSSSSATKVPPSPSPKGAPAAAHVDTKAPSPSPSDTYTGVHLDHHKGQHTAHEVEASKATDKQTAGTTATATAGSKQSLKPKDLKGLIADVVLLGAPLNLRVSVIIVFQF